MQKVAKTTNRPSRYKAEGAGMKQEHREEGPPGWIRARTKILAALEAYPEAREAIIRALEGGGDAR